MLGPIKCQQVPSRLGEGTLEDLWRGLKRMVHYSGPKTKCL
jgi:hypothetical protein